MAIATTVEARDPYIAGYQSPTKLSFTRIGRAEIKKTRIETVQLVKEVLPSVNKPWDHNKNHSLVTT